MSWFTSHEQRCILVSFGGIVFTLFWGTVFFLFLETYLFLARLVLGHTGSVFVVLGLLAVCGVSRWHSRTLLSCGVWDLSSPARAWAWVPCSGRWILNLRTTREVPRCSFLLLPELVLILFLLLDFFLLPGYLGSSLSINSYIWEFYIWHFYIWVILLFFLASGLIFTDSECETPEW